MVLGFIIMPIVHFELISEYGVDQSSFWEDCSFSTKLPLRFCWLSVDHMNMGLFL
jgi:hypothetical protein